MSVSPYIFAFQNRQVELKVLRGLKGELKKHITPLVELTPLLDGKRTIRQYLDDLIYDLSESWISDALFESNINPIIVDGSYLPSLDNLLGKYIWPTRYVVEGLRKYGIDAIPAIGLESSLDMQDSLSQLVLNDKDELCIRVPLSVFESKVYFDEKFNNLTSIVSRDLRKYNFILDLGILSFEKGKNDFQDFLERVVSSISAFSLASELGSFSILGTSFPKSFSRMEEDTWLTLSRFELMVWKNLMRYKSKLKIKPGFGDYGIESLGLKISSGASKIPMYFRYTRENDVLVFKGKDIREYGNKQFQEICMKIINSKYFNGEGYSWGDHCLFEIAKKRKKIGNPKIWKEMAFHHHIGLTIEQIQNFSVKRTVLKDKKILEIEKIV